MKKITVALSLFVLVLSGMSLASCGGSKDKNADSVKNVRKEASAHEATTNICFVNMDSVYNNYTLAKELSAENEKMSLDLQRWANSQQQSVQNSMNTLQQKVQAGQMTEQAAQAEYERIMQRSQNLDAEGQRRATATQNLITANVQRVQDSIHNFLVDFNAINKYDAILASDPSAGVLLSNPAHDVTNEVIEGLNNRYKSEAPAAAKADKTDSDTATETK